LGTSQDFVWDDPEERRKNVLHTKHCLELANALGASSIRVNAGWWRREGEWGGLVETRGWATPWEGSAEDEGFQWAIDGLGACVEEAERQGVMMLLENHWGLTTTADGMLRILEGVNSPWLRAILDTGNFYFAEDMYAEMEKIAPWVDLLHAKTYPGGGKVFTIPVDYPRVFGILERAGFRGYVTIEMEGHEAAETAVPRSVTLLHEAYPS
jgi:L-ribulose-5-phosphate 3-epimerase